jgi:hypothetical protein
MFGSVQFLEHGKCSVGVQSDRSRQKQANAKRDRQARLLEKYPVQRACLRRQRQREADRSRKEKITAN